MLQINTFCNLSKMNIFKSYEQMCCKTLYLAEPIFVELLPDMGSLHEYFYHFRKCLKASIKSLNAAGFKRKNRNGGKVQKPDRGPPCQLPPPLHCGGSVPGAMPSPWGPPAPPCQGPLPLRRQEGAPPHDALLSPSHFPLPSRAWCWNVWSFIFY